MENQIEEIECDSKCSELITLFLQLNKLKNLSGEFIRHMQKLVVLDLYELASLKYLDVSLTGIGHLPVGLQKLKNLYYLNLNGTQKLHSVGKISKLLSLRILRLIGSNVDGDASLIKELQLLEHLQVLDIMISTESGLEQLLGDQRLMNSINSLNINGFQQKPFDMSVLGSMKNLRQLRVVDSHLLEINQTSPLLSNLSKVRILKCSGMKDLTWLLFSPNLVYLNVTFSEVEEIINEEKAANLTGITPFEKLEELIFSTVPTLKSIYWKPLPSPLLRRLIIAACPNLKKLPFNATSVPHIMQPPGQETDLEWEDEDTKNRFSPLLTSGNHFSYSLPLDIHLCLL